MWGICMEVYLEDIQEAEGKVVQLKNQYLRERGWQEEHNQFKDGLLWGKRNISDQANDRKVEIPATQLTTEEALDAEKTFNKTNLHRNNFS